jgi:6-pyruvoyltetrahydropterin/6-carboxytetrahydropterin synthase
MGQYELKVQETISSAHFLRGYEGKCKNLHGHNWKIRATVTAAGVDAIGMVVDFGMLKQKLRETLAHCDHVCLNDLEFFKTHNPTTEYLAQYIYEQFSRLIAPLKLKSIEAWESEQSSVIYTE